MEINFISAFTITLKNHILLHLQLLVDDEEDDDDDEDDFDGDEEDADYLKVVKFIRYRFFE